MPANDKKQDDAAGEAAGGVYIVQHTFIDQIHTQGPWKTGDRITREAYSDIDDSTGKPHIGDRNFQRLIDTGAIRPATAEELKTAPEADPAALGFTDPAERTPPPQVTIGNVDADAAAKRLSGEGASAAEAAKV